MRIQALAITAMVALNIVGPAGAADTRPSLQSLQQQITALQQQVGNLDALRRDVNGLKSLVSHGVATGTYLTEEKTYSFGIGWDGQFESHPCNGDDQPIGVVYSFGTSEGRACTSVIQSAPTRSTWRLYVYEAIEACVRMTSATIQAVCLDVSTSP